MNEPLLLDQASKLARLLLENQCQLVTAESCTGGWAAAACTALPGSSHWFAHGIVSYSNASKQALLGVQPSTLESFGAVSEAVAAEMAQGARADHPQMISLAITGIAGPTGASPGKPVGTVAFAWSWPADRFGGQGLRTEMMVLRGDRAEIRRRSVLHALQGATRLLEGLSGGTGLA